MKRKVFAVTLLVLLVALLMCACGNKEQVTITSIKVVENSMKTQYEIDDPLDISGGQLLLTMSDGSTSYISIDESMIDVSKFNTKTSASKRTLRITYNNLSCSFVYSVKAKELENTIKNVYLENMPTEFLKGEALDVDNGVLKQGLLCIDLGDGNIREYSVKGIWIQDFSTAKTGTFTTTIEYASDYGDVSVNWEYKVLDLASVVSVTPSKKVFVYQGDDSSYLQSALENVTFLIDYSDGTTAKYEYSQSVRIVGFSSNEIGEKSCTLSFYDKEQRLIRFTYIYEVKKVYSVFKVTFDENYPDGSIVIDDTLDGLITPRDAQRTGWEFKGWYQFDGTTLSSQAYDFNQIIESDITLKARWIRSTYTIYFNNLGSITGSITYTVDDERQIPLPDNIPGFIFQYYVDANGNRIDYISKGSTGDLYLTGIWTELGFTITYDLNDSDNDIKATNNNPDVYSSQAEYVFLPAERRGYTFTGWTFNNTPITSTLNQSGALTLVAGWELNVYTVTMVNGETGETFKTVKYRTTDSDTIIDNYQNDSYIFSGWFLDNEYQNEYYKNSSGTYYIPQKSEGNFTLYARVTECYTVRLLTNRNATDGEQIITLTFTNEDKSIELPITAKFGMDFQCWRHQKSMKDFAPIDGKIFLDTEEIKELLISTESGHTFTLNALYTARTYDITYVLYDDVTQSDSYTTDATKTLILPIREGYTFISWHTDKACSDTPIYKIESESMDDNKIFYAKWQPITYYITVHYILEDVTVGIIPSTYTIESETFRLEFPSKERYNFDGWYQDSEYVTPQETTIFKGSHGDIEIYAKWTSQKANITLKNMDNASYSGNLRYPITEGTVTLEDASRSGYTFLGFYKNEYLTVKVDSFDGYDYPDGITLYAKWEIINYTLSYVLNDDKSNPATNNNLTSYNVEDYPELLSPTRNGYTFLGWYSAQKVNNVFDEKYKVASLSGYATNMTLYASWEIANYTITYKGLENYNIQIALASNYTLSGYTLPTLSIDYYVFNGWYEYGTEDKITSLGKTSPCRDIVLEPRVTPIEYKLNYSVNGHSGKSSTTYTIEDFVEGNYTIPTLEKLVELQVIDSSWYKGKKLVSWKSGATVATITTDNTNKTKSTTSTVTAELDWVTYTITYNLNGGTMENDNPTSFTLESSLVLYDAVLENKAFKGWATEEGTILGSHSNGVTTITDIPDNNLSLKAVFVDIYTITYENSIDMAHPELIESFSEAENQALGTPTKENCLFGGWWYKEGGLEVSSTNELSGNSTLIPMFYDKSFTSGLTFALNTNNNTATITGYTKSEKSIILPNSVSGYQIISIESNAFANSSITSITISENIRTIYSYAFSGSKLKKLIIPENVTLIQSYAFNGCQSLTTLEIQGNAEVKSEAFINNTSLTQVTLTYLNGVENNAFKGCSAISKLTSDSSNYIIRIFSTVNPNSSLYYNASGYYIPTALTEITINGEINNALYFLTFSKLTLTSEEVVEISKSVIDLIVSNNATIYVPSSLLEEYKNNADYEEISSRFQSI